MHSPLNPTSLLPLHLPSPPKRGNSQRSTTSIVHTFLKCNTPWVFVFSQARHLCLEFDTNLLPNQPTTKPIYNQPTYNQANLQPNQPTTKPIYNQTNLLPDESTTKLIYDQANLLPNQVRLAAASREALEQPPRKELPSTDASSNTYCHDDTVHDTCAACDPGESWRRGRRGCRLLACPCHLSTACRACFAVAQKGHASAEEEERGVAKEEEVNMEEVTVKVVEEADVVKNKLV